MPPVGEPTTSHVRPRSALFNPFDMSLSVPVSAPPLIPNPVSANPFGEASCTNSTPCEFMTPPIFSSKPSDLSSDITHYGFNGYGASSDCTAFYPAPAHTSYMRTNMLFDGVSSFSDPPTLDAFLVPAPSDQFHPECFEQLVTGSCTQDLMFNPSLFPPSTQLMDCVVSGPRSHAARTRDFQSFSLQRSFTPDSSLPPSSPPPPSSPLTISDLMPDAVTGSPIPLTPLLDPSSDSSGPCPTAQDETSNALIEENGQLPTRLTCGMGCCRVCGKECSFCSGIALHISRVLTSRLRPV
jgi:hypothetical protein